MRVLGHFASYINHYIKIYENPGKIQFVRNNFQFSLHFLAEKFCSMKSFPYLCSVKRMKMVISSVGMLMLSAQFAASVDFPSTLRRSLALKSNVLRLEGLPDGQSTRNGRTADGERAKNQKENWMNSQRPMYNGRCTKSPSYQPAPMVKRSSSNS